MTEIPEHLRKRAEEARAKAAAAAGGDDAAATSAAEAPAAAVDPRIPAHLLERSKAARAKTADAPAGGAVAVAEKVAAVVAAAPAGGGVPIGAGPGGHTQRLLTVVKSGSIQDVKASPIDKVHTWPHLLAVESLEPGMGRVYNLGNGHGATVREVLSACEAAVGEPIRHEIVGRRPGDPAVLVASPDRIKSELGWSPRIVDINEIVATAWRWHRSHPNGYVEDSAD